MKVGGVGAFGMSTSILSHISDFSRPVILGGFFVVCA